MSTASSTHSSPHNAFIEMKESQSECAVALLRRHCMGMMMQSRHWHHGTCCTELHANLARAAVDKLLFFILSHIQVGTKSHMNNPTRPSHTYSPTPESKAQNLLRHTFDHTSLRRQICLDTLLITQVCSHADTRPNIKVVEQVRQSPTTVSRTLGMQIMPGWHSRDASTLVRFYGFDRRTWA